MTSEQFYAQLPALSEFEALTDGENFVPVPVDWLILITDVEQSTLAIARGRYKTVNLLGACSIAAVLNACEGLEIPFIFGGDGATLLIPPRLEAVCREALLGTQALAAREFRLLLRVGIVPVADVRAAGHDVRVAKLRLSPHYSQANLSGGGLTDAVGRVKAVNSRYRLAYTSSHRADFSGLECRWQDIPSSGGDTVSLIVVAIAPSTGVYRQLIATIRRIYGTLEPPLTPKALNLSLNPRRLSLEVQVRAQQGWQKLLYGLRMSLETLVGWLAMRWRLRLGGEDWGRYKEHVICTTDFRKFDDRLQMVLAGSPRQTAQLLTYLQQQQAAKQLVYGLHISDRAIMTCLIAERFGNQVHFIDGADGGYAAAAVQFQQHRQTRPEFMVKSALNRTFE